MEADTDSAARFLRALTGDTAHTFQTFDDDPERKLRALNRVVHGALAQRAKSLASLNARGAGVFVMVNRGDGMGRKAANVTGARSLFVDLDGAPVGPVLSCALPPRIVVESSPGKWHCYWPIVDLPLGRFTNAQRRLAELFDGDRKVHDRCRVMRLPGFWHQKAGAFQTRLERAEGAPYTWSEAASAFGLETCLALPDAVHAGNRNATLYRLAASARVKGVPLDAQLAKALKLNASRCVPPLSETEVRATVASAYNGQSGASMALPLALLDSDAFLSLDHAARMLLILAYRRADGFNGGIVTLPWSELRPWFPREATLEEVRKRAVVSGLLTIHTGAKPAMPRKGRGPEAGFYRLAIGPFSVPYSQEPIGPFSVPSGDLQALAPEAPKCPAGADGPFSAANDSAAAA